MIKVTRPASFLVVVGLGVSARAATWPLALPLDTLGLSFGILSCLLAYSEDSSRRMGVACFVRAMIAMYRVASYGLWLWRTEVGFVAIVVVVGIENGRQRAQMRQPNRVNCNMSKIPRRKKRKVV